MSKEKNIQRSIYFPPALLRRLEADMSVSCRKISGEVVYMLQKMYAIRDKNNAEACELADRRFKEAQDNQPQS